MGIKNIHPDIIKYAERADEITNEEAMDILIDIYITNCGISLTDRTLAENAIHFWIERATPDHPEFDAEYCGLYDVMELRSAQYQKYKNDIDRYDVTVLSASELNLYTPQLVKDLFGDKDKIALCAGILPWLERRIKYEEYERD